MRKLITPLLALWLILPAGAQPRPEKTPHITRIHGVELHDDYFWLREKDNPKVLAHLQAENRYTDEVMKPTLALQEKLYQEMVGRIQETDSQPPLRNGQYYYFARTEKGKQYPIHCRYPAGHPERVEDILDLNKLAEGHSYLGLGEFAVSDDGKWLAYSLDTTGYRQYQLHIKDLGSGQLLPDKAERVTSLCWARDNRTLYYSTEDPVSKRSNQGWRQRVGQAPQLLFEEKDELFDLSCYRSRDRKFICLRSKAKTSDETRYAEADGESRDFRVYSPRRPGHEYYLDHRKNHFYVMTNDHALNFRLVRAADEHPLQWTDIIPSGASKIDDFLLFDKFIAVAARQEGSQELLLLPSDQGPVRRLPMAEPLHELDLAGGQPFDSTRLRYTYQSPITPSTIIEYDVWSGESQVLKKTVVQGGFDSSKYRCERVWITVRDGTRVPLSVVHRADLPWGEQALPVLLYGYGSYGVNYDPRFNSPLISLLDRGVVYAIAHVRGGGEMGEAWRQQGRMLNKLNTFYDFVDVAEALGKKGYSSRVVAIGGSAGGLLMGACANLRGDLFRALIVKVPFVDVLNTMLDASLPLTTGEYIEWGNPNEKEAFDYMRRYSPYDNIEAKPYPAMLVEVSLNDSQVPYWEGAKFAAKVRDLKTDTNQVLVKVNLAAGHGGASGRYSRLRETAFDYAYVLLQMGLTH